ncbi:uncharacterized protein JN550_000046 [Neoarthrinium moseri]|uniref:uncharacterized protein n=1 Tax=Neoarthrinium moseri TaxID=1658444 RepID=UPI001FDD29A0|nr:uncharacterized protein JN550_000046 [Neoarthrinium moseri]KAI1877864.1 hypothetical protein JN550_000046 [Neoarthrinium moseri]
MNQVVVELVSTGNGPLIAPPEAQIGHGQSNGTESSRQEFTLPPVDSGKDAWLFLAACWVVEALVWVCRLYARQARWFTQAGLFAAALTIALSSFCTTVPQLVATQGVLFGIGGCFAYTPCVLYIDEWFAARKGLAYGIMWSAAGFGGVVLPLLLGSLLDAYGFRATMRIWAGILFAASFPLAFFVRPRLPVAAAAHTRPFDMRYVLTRFFALHQVANTVQATGYFLPAIYLPSYARMEFDASTFLSALTVLLVNIASTVGSVAMGSMTDRLHTTTCIIISTMGAAVGVFLLWGLSSSLPVLYVFCVVYGLFAGCWTTIWPAIMKEMTRQGEVTGQYVDPTMVFGWLCVGRGIGNIASGPLSGLLLTGGSTWVGRVSAGFGSGYAKFHMFIALTYKGPVPLDDVKLASGYEIPLLGFGVYQTPAEEAERCVKDALEAGYRHVDSAAAYRNEEPCGSGIRALASKIPRSEVFFTSKVRTKGMSYESAKATVDETLRLTGLGHIDLMLLHAPYGGSAARKGAWKGLVEAVEAGKVRSIGVSNYGVHHLQELSRHMAELEAERPGGGGVVSVGQWEIHPWLPRNDIVSWARAHGVAIQAYCPLVRGERWGEPALQRLAEKHGKTGAQVLLRWSLQKGYIPLPKSVTTSRIRENAQIYDFELSEEDMATLETTEYAPCTWDPTTSPLDNVQSKW